MVRVLGLVLVAIVAMARGFRLVELDTYMVRGDYQEPAGAWVPSPFY